MQNEYINQIIEGNCVEVMSAIDSDTIDLTVTSPPQIYRKRYNNEFEFMLEDQEAKGHPAPFPCALVRDHIVSWTNKDDLVFDPMCGSGKTCKVASQLDRKCRGF